MRERLLIEVEDLQRVPRGMHLIVAMHGFGDAANVPEQVANTLLETLPNHMLVDFDTDLLIDHRARRPRMDFEADHFTAYEPHVLSLSMVRDDAGRAFLLLHGPEPDYRWDQFVAEVMELAERLHVASVAGVLSVGMPVPHTRPVSMTVSGNQQELIDRLSSWQPTVSLPACATYLLEYRMREHWPVATFCILTPHYIGAAGFAAPTLKALEALTEATGLVFRTEQLRELDREFQQAIAGQLEEQDELRTLVGELESRYDAFVDESERQSPLVDENGSVPSADDIAADLQRFLAMRQERSGDEGFFR